MKDNQEKSNLDLCIYIKSSKETRLLANLKLTTASQFMLPARPE